MPWSIVRATGFYWLLDRMLAKMTRRPIVILPGDVHMQPVDSDEFADFIVAAVADSRRGEREDFVGPETLAMRALAEQYLAARSQHRRIWNAPLPRRVKAALEAGNTSSHARRGTTTWADWLRRSAAQRRPRPASPPNRRAAESRDLRRGKHSDGAAATCSPGPHEWFAGIIGAMKPMKRATQL